MKRAATVEPDHAAHEGDGDGLEPCPTCPVCIALAGGAGAGEETEPPARCAGCGVELPPARRFRLCGISCALDAPADDHVRRIAAHRARVARELARLRALRLNPDDPRDGGRCEVALGHDGSVAAPA